MNEDVRTPAQLPAQAAAASAKLELPSESAAAPEQHPAEYHVAKRPRLRESGEAAVQLTLAAAPGRAGGQVAEHAVAVLPTCEPGDIAKTQTNGGSADPQRSESAANAEGAIAAAAPADAAQLAGKLVLSNGDAEARPGGAARHLASAAAPAGAPALSGSGSPEQPSGGDAVQADGWAAAQVADGRQVAKPDSPSGGVVVPIVAAPAAAPRAAAKGGDAGQADGRKVAQPDSPSGGVVVPVVAAPAAAPGSGTKGEPAVAPKKRGRPSKADLAARAAAAAAAAGGPAAQVALGLWPSTCTPRSLTLQGWLKRLVCFSCLQGMQLLLRLRSLCDNSVCTTHCICSMPKTLRIIRNSFRMGVEVAFSIALCPLDKSWFSPRVRRACRRVPARARRA